MKPGFGVAQLRKPPARPISAAPGASAAPTVDPMQQPQAAFGVGSSKVRASAAPEAALSAAQLFELCTGTLRLVKGRRLTAWELHAALPRYVQVPMTRVTKVMMAVAGAAAGPKQLQQHKPPPGQGGHLAWSWCEHKLPSPSSRPSVCYAAATTSTSQPVPSRVPSASAARPTYTRSPPRGTKRPRQAPVRQADLFASAAVELDDDVAASAQRTKQANRFNDFMMQHLTEEQLTAGQGVHLAQQLAQLRDVTTEQLAAMTPLAVLQVFRHRLHVLHWAQGGDEASISVESLARASIMLGLPVSHTAAENKKRFRSLARVLHPDKCNMDGAIDVFLALKQASGHLQSAGR